MPGPSLTLEEYRAATRHLPRPDRAQLENFALYVSQAHSWYKRLPFGPPGMGFCFYVDPCAGMDFFNRGGTVFEAAWRDSDGSHYNQLPTATHRERHGYMSFSFDGSVVEPPELAYLYELRLVGGLAPAIHDVRSGKFRLLPPEVVKAGRASFSCVVHEHCMAAFQWSMLAGSLHPTRWPKASGGPEIIARLQTRLSELDALRAAQNNLPEGKLTHIDVNADPIVDELLAPERRRQHLGMIAAAERVVALIHGEVPTD